MARKKRNPQKLALAQAILKEYYPQSVEDVNEALKDILVLYSNQCFKLR